MKKLTSVLALSIAVAACAQDTTYVEKASPANAYKDYRENMRSVVGVGEPVSKRQMRVNATITLQGSMTLDEVMERIAKRYNVAVRWHQSVRRSKIGELLASEQTFNDVRSYIEDVYKVRVVREAERRLVVLPGEQEKRIKEFAPGVDVTLSQALRGLAAQCDLNLVITENKDRLQTAKVTTTLKDVTCPDAFDALLSPYGMSLVSQGDYSVIGGLPSRTWSVNLYEPTRTEQQDLTFSSNVQGEGDSGGSVGGQTATVVREERDLWKELSSDLANMLGNACDDYEMESSQASTDGASDFLLPPGVGGAVSSNTATSTTDEDVVEAEGELSQQYSCGYIRVNRAVGVVTMKAPASVIQRANEVIKRVEDIASRRLLVEARLIAVSRERSFDEGGDISGSIGSNNDTGFFGSQPQNNALRSNTTIAGMLASLGVSGGGGFLGYRGDNLDAVVRYVESFGTTYNLMHPTLEVMDRQRAVIIDGRNEIYYVREAEVIPTDGSNPIVNATAEERTQFIGLQFAITAQVADGDQPHTLAVQIPITEISRIVQREQTINGDQFIDEIPIATTRVIDQKVRIKDGEIKVIGGLTRTLAIDRESGVPLIRGVPLAGKLFNEENIQFEDVEFIVLLQVKRLY